MATSNLGSSEALDSAGKVVRAVPQVVTGLLSLSALGYFIGWREASAYFAALGAPWAASGLTPLALLQLSSTTVVVIGMSAYVAYGLVVDGQATANGLGWICAVCLMLSCVGFIPSIWDPLHVAVETKYWLAVAGALLYAVAAGFTAAELIVRFKSSNSQVLPIHFWLIYWIILYGLFSAPSRLGLARAHYHVDPTSTALPTVSLMESSPRQTWRLVYISDGKALLISPDKQREKSEFRVVEVTQLQSISTLLQPMP